MRVCASAVGEPKELIGNVLERFAYPSPCVAGVRTKIVSRTRPSVRERRGFVVIRFGDEILVYEKEVFDEAVARFREYGRLILAGVPGTGKSQLAKLLALLDGRYYKIVTPDAVLSKWVGDSEKKLRRLLDEATATGTVLILDEGDWLLGARSLMGEGRTAEVQRNLVNIMLTRLQEDKNLRVILTTNMPAEYFDPAILRAGRLGEPLYIPPPKPGAIEVLGEELGLPLDRIEEAKKLLGYTTSFADIVLFMKKGVKPKGVKRHRGYTVIYAEEKSDRLYHKAVIPEALPVAMLIAAIVTPGPLVVVEDHRYVEDAIAVAEQMGGSVYVYADHDYVIHQKLMLARVSVAVTIAPRDETLERINLTSLSHNDRRRVARLAEKLWGCKGISRSRTAEELRRRIIECYSTRSE